jgi:glycerophosphoryl diester phosphodiesterase
MNPEDRFYHPRRARPSPIDYDQPVHPALASTRPLVFAHRGGSKLGPENTIVAFDRGLAIGADGLELDVHLSRDGVVVVHHDRVLGRTNRGSGPVRGRTAAELAAFDVPTLREVLDRYPATRLIIELKESGADLARAVLDEVRRAGAANRVCLGSFSLRALRAARAIDPAIASSAALLEARLALYCSWVNVSTVPRPYSVFQVPEVSGGTRVVSPRFVRLAHKAGIAVQVWTVDDPGDMRRLLEWGVDGIISDRPDVAVEVVRDWMAHRRS